MDSLPGNQPSVSPWLSDSADPRVIDFATQMFLEGQDEAAIRHEVGLRGITDDQQDALLANMQRQAGKKRASFDKQTASAKTRALATVGIGAIAVLLGVGLLFVAPVFPYGILIVGAVLLVQGSVAYTRASKRQFASAV